MKNIKTYLILLLFSLASISQVKADGHADKIQVIVNAQSELSKLSRKHVMSLFLGRARSFPNGKPAKAFDNEMGSDIRSTFFEVLTGKSISDIDAYWARLRYSGRASPPKELDSTSKILEVVGSDNMALAYVRGQDEAELEKQGILVVYTLEAN